MIAAYRASARSLVEKLFFCFLALALVAGPAAASDADEDSVKTVKLEIRNRLFPDFREVVETGMHQKVQIGDTDYSFEVTEFYPHFAITDSTKKVISLSKEPKNPAFKIKVYEKDEPVEAAWAFYGAKAPHFSRTAYLVFSVLRFDYRGTVYGGDEHEKSDEESADGKKES